MLCVSGAAAVASADAARGAVHFNHQSFQYAEIPAARPWGYCFELALIACLCPLASFAGLGSASAPPSVSLHFSLCLPNEIGTNGSGSTVPASSPRVPSDSKGGEFKTGLSPRDASPFTPAGGPQTPSQLFGGGAAAGGGLSLSTSGGSAGAVAAMDGSASPFSPAGIEAASADAATRFDVAFVTQPRSHASASASDSAASGVGRGCAWVARVTHYR